MSDELHIGGQASASADRASDDADPVEAFACLLFETLEHLDPSMEARSWGDLSDDTREVYRQCVLYLCDRPSIIFKCLDYITSANDDTVDRGCLIGEKTELGHKIS